MLKSMKKGLDKLGRDVQRGADSVAKSIETSVKGKKEPTPLDNFQTGNVVCLLSHSSGKSLQVVASPDNKLVVDGKGPDSGEAQHAHWSILNEGVKGVHLHNQNNFLCIKDGATQIVNFTDHTMAGAETCFRLSLCGQYVTLESIKDGGHHVGVLSTGELKPALVTGKEIDGQFGVKLIYTTPTPEDKNEKQEEKTEEKEPKQESGATAEKQ